MKATLPSRGVHIPSFLHGLLGVVHCGWGTVCEPQPGHVDACSDASVLCFSQNAWPHDVTMNGACSSDQQRLHESPPPPLGIALGGGEPLAAGGGARASALRRRRRERRDEQEKSVRSTRRSA